MILTLLLGAKAGLPSTSHLAPTISPLLINGNITATNGAFMLSMTLTSRWRLINAMTLLMLLITGRMSQTLIKRKMP